jgi:hypothetical protein
MARISERARIFPTNFPAAPANNTTANVRRRKTGQCEKLQREKMVCQRSDATKPASAQVAPSEHPHSFRAELRFFPQALEVSRGRPGMRRKTGKRRRFLSFCKAAKSDAERTTTGKGKGKGSFPANACCARIDVAVELMVVRRRSLRLRVTQPAKHQPPAHVGQASGIKFASGSVWSKG